jgi:hypothetical protein
MDIFDTQPTLVDTVARHEKEIQELKRLITPMMEFKRREWVGLTEDEIWQAWLGPKDSVVDFASAIEDKLKEKNNG